MIHKVKIQKEYADRILDGKKTFEVRYNDRDYQVGDYLQYEVITSAWSSLRDLDHKLNNALWEIIYIHSGLGMQEKYVVLGIKELEDKNNEQYR